MSCGKRGIRPWLLVLMPVRCVVCGQRHRLQPIAALLCLALYIFISPAVLGAVLNDRWLVAMAYTGITYIVTVILIGYIFSLKEY